MPGRTKPPKVRVPRVGKSAPTARVPIGPPPTTPSEAWWKLSRQAKQLLQEKRKQGFFGGMVGKATYWYVQEVGEPKAEIRPQQYIARAVRRFERRARVRIREWIYN